MEEGERLVWKSEAAESMMSVTLGRAMSALLSARLRKLNDAVSRLSSDPRTRPSLGSFLKQKGFADLLTRENFYFRVLIYLFSFYYYYFCLNAFAGSLEESLWFLHKYARDAAEKEESLDDILIPMVENV